MLPTCVRLIDGFWRICVGKTPLRGKYLSRQIAESEARRIGKVGAWR